MPYKDPEKRKEYARKLYHENKEKKSKKMKEYYDKNKETILQQQKTPEGIKTHRIKNWKSYGLICEDVDRLYEHYLNTTQCDECDVELTTDRYNTATTKCMDHCHKTGEFRNILCLSCNSKRK